MLGLIGNVLDNDVDLGLAHGESCVASLPLELRMGMERASNPGVGGSLEFLDSVRQRSRAPQTGQQMNMVLDAAHTDDGTVEAIGDLAEISVELLSQSHVLKDREAMFCREDEVDADSRKRLGHAVAL